MVFLKKGYQPVIIIFIKIKGNYFNTCNIIDTISTYLLLVLVIIKTVNI